MSTTDELRRHELATFLRSRRERISPAQVGLPPGGRRRTPGLRREEVAQLAGVGVTWYTWLEQGRDITVSEQVLDAISRTLMFDRHERYHLYTLAGATDLTNAKDCAALAPQVPVLLDRLEPYPALVRNSRFDVLAFNRAYRFLTTDDFQTVPIEDRNTLWLAFTSPRFRLRVVDWDQAVAHMVATFRAELAEHVGEPAWKCLLRRLQDASPEFAEMWDRHDVRSPENRTKHYEHPDVGRLNLDYTHLWLGPRQGTRVVTYTPADEVTAQRLERLAALKADVAAAEPPARVAS